MTRFNVHISALAAMTGVLPIEAETPQAAAELAAKKLASGEYPDPGYEFIDRGRPALGSEAVDGVWDEDDGEEIWTPPAEQSRSLRTLASDLCDVLEDAIDQHIYDHGEEPADAPERTLIRETRAAIASPEPGMSLRDWFAGQAPDVPNWFVHRPPDKSGLPAFPAVNALPIAEHRDAAQAWITSEREEADYAALPEELRWFADQHTAAAIAYHRYNWADLMARLVQWRYAYADAMMAQRNAL